MPIRSGERRMVRMTDHSMMAATTTTTSATAATSTEVSICRPCQVIAISPGRSAIQTKPKAASATAARKMRTRIIAQPASRRGFQRRNRVGVKLATRLDGLGARLGLGGPGSQCGLRTDLGGELLELGQCPRDIALPGALLGSD